MVDIGTDHAYVPIKVINDGIAKKCIACDLREGPLKIANKNIEQNGMNEKIETRLGFGLDVINKDETDCVVIAGMGGTLIKNILDRGMDKISPKSIIITQPNIYQQDVRKWFYENGFNIYKEKLVLEDKRIYNIICARFGETKKEVTEFDYYISDKILEDPLCGVYMENMLTKYKRALHGMSNMKNLDEISYNKYKYLVSNLEKELKRR